MTKHYQFNARYPFVLLTIGAFILFVSLGFWQLSRGHEKQILQRDFETRKNAPPLSLAQLPTHTDLRYYSVKVTGYYDNVHSLLLDNKIYRHRVGYEVITPFWVNDQKVVLINRGWIPAPPNRAILPSIPEEKDAQTITGMIYFPPNRPFILRQETFPKNQWPLRIQSLQIPVLAKILHHSLYPFVLLLSPAQGSQGFVRDWQPVNMPAHKHWGYAAQWFTFAVVVIIIFIVLNTRKLKK